MIFANSIRHPGRIFSIGRKRISARRARGGDCGNLEETLPANTAWQKMVSFVYYIDEITGIGTARYP